MRKNFRKHLSMLGVIFMLGPIVSVSANQPEFQTQIQTQIQSASQNQSELQAAFDFIDQNIIDRRDLTQLDLARAEAAVEVAVEVISAVLADKSLPLKYQIYHRWQRAESYRVINFYRLHNDGVVAVSEAVQALEDLDFILKFHNSRSLEYDAGHIAMHLVKDSVAAYKYWQSCAEQEHAGCNEYIGRKLFHRYRWYCTRLGTVGQLASKGCSDRGQVFLCRAFFKLSIGADCPGICRTSRPATAGSIGLSKGAPFILSFNSAMT